MKTQMNSNRQNLKAAALFLFLCATSSFAYAQENINEKLKEAFYKARFDDRDGRYDEKIDDARIRPLGTTETRNATKNPTLRTAATPRSLPGTAWKIDFGKGVTGTVFLFCKGGQRWEIVPQRAGTIGAVGKSYSVSGNTLTTVNADDGMVQKWKMTWEGDVLAINDGKVTLRLHYNGETQCK